MATTIDGTSGITAAVIEFTGRYQTTAQALSGTVINCASQTNYFTATVAANTAFTVANIPASGTVYSFALEITHTSGTITWFNGVVWPDAIPPTILTGRKHLFMFITDDGGATWRAAALANYTV